MQITAIQWMASVCFFGALLHSLSVSAIEKFSRAHASRHAQPTVLGSFLHYAAEIEVVFGIWAALYIGFLILHQGFQASVEWLDHIHFQEAIFVFVIMTMAATRPIMRVAETLILGGLKLIPISKTYSAYLLILILGPLLGSLITEPAAMTVAAPVVKKAIFRS